MTHMAHTGRVLAGRVLAGRAGRAGAGRVLAHTTHALVLRGQRALVLRPAPWCCAARRLRPGSAEAGVAGPSG
jgi:hypothetical protein